MAASDVKCGEGSNYDAIKDGLKYTDQLRKMTANKLSIQAMYNNVFMLGFLALLFLHAIMHLHNTR